MVCIGMKSNGVNEEHVKLKAFLFFLKGAANAWFFLYSPRFHWNFKCHEKDIS